MAAVELEVAGLVKRYAPQVAIGPISFSVMEGEFFSLLGPSGCGKTTTLRCIAGFERASAGRITLSGRQLDDTPPHRRDVGLVFQNYALFPHLTVFENVAFGLRLRRVSAAEVAERVGRMLELVGLPSQAGRYPAQLSGGQQQRIAIARSMVLEPRLLLFDEPLSNLDFKLRVQMRNELRELQRRLGKTSVYVTHDQTEALALSDRIAVLSQGRIEQIGPPAEIYEAPETAFVADFIGSSNIIEATVRSKGAESAVVSAPSGLELVVPPTAAEIGARCLVMVRPERVRLLGDAEGGDGEGRDGEASALNRIAAEIDDLTYLGEDIQLRVTASSGERLLVSLKSARMLRHLRRGGAVTLAIDPPDIHHLRR